MSGTYLRGGIATALVGCVIGVLGAQSEAATPLVSALDARTFIGGRSGKLVYTVWEGTDGIKNGRKLCYLDFNENPMVEHVMVTCTNTEPRNAVISPDGKWVAYNTTDDLPNNANNSQVFVCELKTGATSAAIGPGAQPHWWVKPGTSTSYIIYATCDIEECWQTCVPSEQVRWGSPCYGTAQSYGKTMIAQIANGQLSGSPKEFFPWYTNGGRSRQGGLLFTAARATGTFEIDPALVATPSYKAVHPFASDDEGCNPSISPHPLDVNTRVLWLNVPHDSLFIGTRTGTIAKMIGINDAGNKFWDTPEWSTDADYAASVASPGDVLPPFDIYLVRLTDGQCLRVLDGNYQYPHLWIDPTQSSTKRGGHGRIDSRSARVDRLGSTIRVSGSGLAGSTMTVQDLRGRVLMSSRLSADLAQYSTAGMPGAAIVSVRDARGSSLHALHLTGGR